MKDNSGRETGKEAVSGSQWNLKTIKKNCLMFFLYCLILISTSWTFQSGMTGFMSFFQVCFNSLNINQSLKKPDGWFERPTTKMNRAQSVPLRCLRGTRVPDPTTHYSTADWLPLEHTCSRRLFSVLIVNSRKQPPENVWWKEKKACIVADMTCSLQGKHLV